MDTSKLAKIKELLAKKVAELTAGQELRDKNREAAIVLCDFIRDTILAIDPENINVMWLGSYDQPNVAQYPVVYISAVFEKDMTVLAKWRIDTGGTIPAPRITEDDILDAVLSALHVFQ